MNGKLFAIATLFAVILLTVAFIPIASQQSGPAGTYDPWADYNGDGKIDITDIANSAIRFGTTGDPSRNVTIERHATKLIKAADGVPVAAGGIWDLGTISVDGYSKVTILINFETNLNDYRLRVHDTVSSLTYWIADQATNFNQYLVKTYDVMNQVIEIIVYNHATSSARLFVDIYLMA